MRFEQFVSSVGQPVFGAVTAPAADFSAVTFRAAAQGYAVRAVRGAKMRTVTSVLDEFAAALQFPWYFGENKDAFDECLRDLDEFVGAAPGYVIAVRDAEQLLDAEPAERAWLASALSDCAATQAARPAPVRFRVVLQAAGSGLLPAPFAGATPVYL